MLLLLFVWLFENVVDCESELYFSSCWVLFRCRSSEFFPISMSSLGWNSIRLIFLFWPFFVEQILGLIWFETYYGFQGLYTGPIPNVGLSTRLGCDTKCEYKSILYLKSLTAPCLRVLRKSFLWLKVKPFEAKGLIYYPASRLPLPYSSREDSSPRLSFGSGLFVSSRRDCI